MDAHRVCRADLRAVHASCPHHQGSPTAARACCSSRSALTLAAMNLSFYLALDRLPMSLVAAMEFRQHDPDRALRAAQRAQPSGARACGRGRVRPHRLQLVVGPRRPRLRRAQRRAFRRLHRAWPQGRRRRGRARRRDARRGHGGRLHRRLPGRHLGGYRRAVFARAHPCWHWRRPVLIGHPLCFRPAGDVAAAARDFRADAGAASGDGDRRRRDRAAADTLAQGHSRHRFGDGRGGAAQAAGAARPG